MFERSQTRQPIFKSTYADAANDSDVSPVNRKNELEEIAAAIRPVIHQNASAAVVITGEPGTGKTTCVNHVLKKIDEETHVKPVYINCWQYNTRPSLLTHLLIELGYPAPRKGKPVDELLSILREWLRKNRSIVVALDEFDQLRDQTEIVYDLYQLNREVDNALGQILISNESSVDLQLDPRSGSRLDYSTIEFAPYDASALIDILRDHMDRFFRPGVVSEDVLRSVATHVAEEQGDCRRGINLLHRAGQRAEQEGAEVVTPDHVAAAVDRGPPQ
jgi:cell division control protein 6